MKKILICLLFVCGQLFGQTENIEKIKNTVTAWSDAHNNRDFSALNVLYAPRLLFYCKEQDKSFCINAKSKALKASPNFQQRIVSAIEITFYESGIVKCSFTKEVHSKKVKAYRAYLLLKAENESYVITGESDELTDANLHYILNLGNQIIVMPTKGNGIGTRELLIIFSVLVVIIVILIIIVKQIKNNKTNTIVSTKPTIENITNESSYTETIKANEPKMTSAEAAEKAKQAFTTTLNQTKTFVTKVFNTADGIDRALYGKRMKIFIIGCFAVLLGAPFVDALLKLDDLVTFLTTFAFLIFILILVFSFIGSWRDDNGNVTWARTLSRLQTYRAILSDTIANTKTSSQVELLYKTGRLLFFVGIAWATFKNLSLFVRKLFWYSIGAKIEPLMAFEKSTSYYYFLPIIIGVIIIVYLCKQNTQILERIKSELGQLIGLKINNTKYKAEIVKINSTPSVELVVNAKEEQQLNTIMALSNSVLFNDFALAVQNWNPRGAYYEYEYQDRLLRHLRKSLPNTSIESEYPIGERQAGTRGRADIVINNTILIEMKRDSSAGAIQRAKGQIAQYSEAWKNKGPVILLLCDYDFEHARTAYGSTMQDQLKLGRPVLTIVAKTK